MRYASLRAPYVDRCLFGDVREQLATVPAGIVQCVVTSPPFYGLRDYGCDGQIGLEPTPEEYIAALVETFREVRRVLRDDGVLWLEIGDSYANDGKWGGSSGGKHVKGLHGDTGIGRGKRTTGLKPKDLIGIPWALAFALRADGWYLRAENIWHKPNPMPESVRDRTTRSHSQVFLLTKGARYFYDCDAVREIWADDRCGNPGSPSPKAATTPGQRPHTIGSKAWESSATGRNRRSVWTIATRPYSGAHFAVFPPDLIKPLILAGTSEKGCCAECGAPGLDCDHDAPAVPCLILDPFFGSGTTGQVAQDLGRSWLGCELNEDYGALQDKRTAQLGLLGALL